MLYQFNKSVHLCGKDYLRGIREVPETVESHAHFLKYVSLGFIVSCDASKVVNTDSPKERSEKLLNTLIDRRKPKAPKVEVKAEEPVKVEESLPEIPKESVIKKKKG